jgi:3-isopropylmalate/(R)-2-methylmalate dehydratase small subunit
VVVSDEIAHALAERASLLDHYSVEIDLAACRWRDGHGIDASFAIDDASRHRLLHGLDEIALILQHEADIAAYEAAQG